MAKQNCKSEDAVDSIYTADTYSGFFSILWISPHVKVLARFTHAYL